MSVYLYGFRELKQRTKMKLIGRQEEANVMRSYIMENQNKIDLVDNEFTIDVFFE